MSNIKLIGIIFIIICVPYLVKTELYDVIIFRNVGQKLKIGMNRNEVDREFIKIDHSPKLIEAASQRLYLVVLPRKFTYSTFTIRFDKSDKVVQIGH